MVVWLCVRTYMYASPQLLPIYLHVLYMAVCVVVCVCLQVPTSDIHTYVYVDTLNC